MRRPDLAHLEALDPEIRAAAEKAARRAGLSLEDWIAAVIARHGAESSPERSGHPADKPPGGDFETIMAAAEAAERERRPDQASRNAVALESMALWIEQAEERLNEAARTSADQQDRMATALSQTLSSLRGRLETVERRVAAEPASSTTLEDALKAMSPVADSLVELRRDVSRLTQRLDEPSPSVIGEIRQDIDRVRMGMESLATHSQIATLDETFRLLSRDLERSPSSKDLLTLAGSIASLNRKIDSLSDTVADGAHQRIGSEIELIGRKVEQLAATSVDRSVIDFLSSQIVDLRQDLVRRADPQQIDRLSEAVAALSRQVADGRAEQVGRGDLAALKLSLEDVCAALGRSVAAQEQSDVPNQLQDMSRRLDFLVSRPAPEPANLDPIAEQLAVLTERMAHMADARLDQNEAIGGHFDRLTSQIATVVDNTASLRQPLLERFERLEGELRQVGQQADTSAIELMLRSLEEKLADSAAPAPVLNVLEQRVAAFSEQLSQMPETYRQAFEDAAAHLKSLQKETALIAERAAATAVKNAGTGALAMSELDALKAGFAELKALQARADKKTQQTLCAVHDALETLVSRFATASPVSQIANGAARPASDLPSPDRLEAAVRRLHASALSQIEEIAANVPEVTLPISDRVPEPDAGRTAAIIEPEAAMSDVRASFIAAARRASRTLPPPSAEVMPSNDSSPAEATAVQDSADGEPRVEADKKTDLSTPSLFERLRRTLDAHRRPLLFGLAFLVLAAGTTQILSNAPYASASGAAAPGTTSAIADPIARPQETPANTIPAIVTAAGAKLFQPSSLSSASTPPASFSTTRFTLDPATLGDLPAEVPAVLRQPALSGDATAVYEVALRALEGRGLPRDPALAFRLLERAAQAGLAPAQERLAILYDKGIGTTRDAKLAGAWYERAAQGGNVRAMHNLATLLTAGVSGKPDYAGALQWYTEAAEAGVRDSQFNMGVLLARGVGTRKDPAKAFHWFALAAAQGDAEAAKKRDEIASRLTAAELNAAKASLEGWRPRQTDPLANDVPPRPGDRTAAIGAPADDRS